MMNTQYLSHEQQQQQPQQMFQENHIQTSPINKSSMINVQQDKPVRSAYYEANWPVCGLDWAWMGRAHQEYMAISSYREETTNKIQVLYPVPTTDVLPSGQGVPGYDFFRIAESKVDYPCTRLQWEPNSLEPKLASSGDCLRIWELNKETRQLETKLTLMNRSKSEFLPPLTSFYWNKIDPSLILTSSIDTTCTIWDINQGGGSAKTQLIAHDSEVYDAQFTAGSVNIFASVGADGSMRVFDLRSLDHSTIIFEPPTPSKTSPLLRVAASNIDGNLLATISGGDNKIFVLDIRFPGTPIVVLEGHEAAVNSISWHPTKNILVSGADDCQALIWDVITGDANIRRYNSTVASGPPTLRNSGNSSKGVGVLAGVYGDTGEINNVRWSRDGDWIGVASGRSVQGVRVVL